MKRTVTPAVGNGEWESGLLRSLWRRNMCWYVLQTFKNGCHPRPREFCCRNLSWGDSQTCARRHFLQEWITIIFHRKKLKTMEMSNIWGLVKTNSVSSWEEYYIVIMTKKIFNSTVFLLTVNKLLHNIYIEVLGFQQPVLKVYILSFIHQIH